jgi:hypothetical protein
MSRGAPVGTLTGRNELHHQPQQFAKFPALPRTQCMLSLPTAAETEISSS